LEKAVAAKSETLSAEVKTKDSSSVVTECLSGMVERSEFPFKGTIAAW